MHRGYRRLAILLTCVWVTFIFLVIAYQTLTPNPNCQTSEYNNCYGLIWSLFYERDGYFWVIDWMKVLLSCIAPPIVGLILVRAIRWVKRGFDHDESNGI